MKTLEHTVDVTEEQAKYYRDNGFVQINDMLSSEEVEELRMHLREAMEKQGDNSVQTSQQGNLYFNVLNQRVNTWRDHGGMARFVMSRRFAEAAKRLTGAGGIRLFHDHALFKMPQDSKPTPWHQDFVYWPMTNSDRTISGSNSGPLSIWIALDDVDEHNGCMMFIPKSQKLKNLKNVDLVNPHDIFSDEGAKDVDRNTAVICRMKAGSVTFHDGLTFHYAHANKTNNPRRALAIIYMPEDTIHNGKPHVVTADQPLEVGKPFSGGLFPKLA